MMENAIYRDQEILAKIQKEDGWIANPLKLMEKRPGSVEKFVAYNEQVFGKGSLTPREKALISLAATVALRADHCIHTKIEQAKKAGISEDEIIQTMLITGLINGNTMLHTAYKAFAGSPSCE